MKNKIEKSYNPFKMWGSWVGFGVGIIIIFFYISYTNEIIPNGYNPPFYFLYELGSIIRNMGGVLFVIVGILLSILSSDLANIVVNLLSFLMIPFLSFCFGWVIHLIILKNLVKK